MVGGAEPFEDHHLGGDDLGAGPFHAPEGGVAVLGAAGADGVGGYVDPPGAVEEAESWGFFNRLCAPESVLGDAQALARELAAGPSFAHAMTKRMLHEEWDMSIEQAIEAEAQAQAICMQTRDFERAYRAFVAREKPVFEGT